MRRSYGGSMRRREFITGISAATAWPVVARAQQPARIPRVGYLAVASPSDGRRGAEAFEAGLRELGHVPGKSLAIDYRWASGRYEQLERLASELIQIPVDVIFAPTTAAALAAQKVTAAIPIVFSNAYAPVETGLVTSLARPGGKYHRALLLRFVRDTGKATRAPARGSSRIVPNSRAVEPE